MEIPALYSVYRGGEVRAAPAKFEEAGISFLSEPEKITFSAADAEDRIPLLVVDAKGFARREMDDRLLTNMKFPGSDVWFLTYIRDIEDVFDSFIGDIEKVLIPVHTVRNELVLSEAHEVSENGIPALFVSQGKVLRGKDQISDTRSAAERMFKIGFSEIAVVDTDSSLKSSDWASLGRYHDVVPFVKDKNVLTGIEGFERIIFDLL